MEDENKSRGGRRENSGRKPVSDEPIAKTKGVTSKEDKAIDRLRELDPPTRQSFFDWLFGNDS